MVLDSQALTEAAPNPTEGSLPDVVRHLVHEMRQPLSGIESLTYYLGLVLGEDDELSAHCDRLRRLVHQANWSLEDASFAICGLSRPLDLVDLNAALRDLAEERAGHSDQPLPLELGEDLPPVPMPRGTGARLLEHLLAVFLDIAVVENPPRFRTSRSPAGVLVTIEGEIHGGALPEVMRAVDPPGASGGVARFASALGGEWSVRSDGNTVRLELGLPAAGEAGAPASVDDGAEVSRRV